MTQSKVKVKVMVVRKLRNWLISVCLLHQGCIYIFFWIPYWPRILINILWHPLSVNQYGGSIWRTGSNFNCRKRLWDCLPTKPITTKHQSVFWLVSQSRRMSATYVVICRWISLAAASAASVPPSVCL